MAVASSFGIFFGSCNLRATSPTKFLIMVPVKMFAKKTFHIMKYRSLMQALNFLPLRETEPSMVEKKSISGGAMYRNNINMTLGKYPVASWLINFLQKQVKDKKSHPLYVLGIL